MTEEEKVLQKLMDELDMWRSRDDLRHIIWNCQHIIRERQMELKQDG